MTSRSRTIINTLLSMAVVAGVVLVIHDQNLPHDTLPEDTTSEAQPPLPMVTIHLGDVPLRVEVADEPRERELGYMYRDRPEGTGMLFVMDVAEPQSFWMPNVSFDIDLAYIRSDGTISETLLMKANDRTKRESREPAQYVLETAAGWLAANGVGPGTLVRIPPEARLPAGDGEGGR